jgi:hypothetical protein
VYVIAAPRECKLLLRREDAAYSTTAARCRSFDLTAAPLPLLVDYKSL